MRNIRLRRDSSAAIPCRTSTTGGSPQTQAYPFTAPQYNFAITWGLDNKLKTPYSENLDFSIQRQLPGGFIVEGAYVGRLGHHLLQASTLRNQSTTLIPRAEATTTLPARNFPRTSTPTEATTA